MDSSPIRVTVWNEGRHEQKNAAVRAIYPTGIHGTLCDFLNARPAIEAAPAVMDEPEHGLSVDRLNRTDVLLWWGHLHHVDVQLEVVDRVHERVLSGMGIIVLHSGHFSRIFKRLMGTTCDLKWREHQEEREVLWVTRPGHPIVAGIHDHFVLEHEEMYGEYFDIPEPETTFLISGFTGGEVFRSGCTWTRGAGRVVYFRPGHETFPTYHHPTVQKVIENAVRWCRPTYPPRPVSYGQREMGWVREIAEEAS